MPATCIMYWNQSHLLKYLSLASSVRVITKRVRNMIHLLTFLNTHRLSPWSRADQECGLQTHQDLGPKREVGGAAFPSFGSVTRRRRVVKFSTSPHHHPGAENEVGKLISRGGHEILLNWRKEKMTSFVKCFIRCLKSDDEAKKFSRNFCFNIFSVDYLNEF